MQELRAQELPARAKIEARNAVRTIVLQVLGFGGGVLAMLFFLTAFTKGSIEMGLMRAIKSVSDNVQQLTKAKENASDFDK